MTKQLVFCVTAVVLSVYSMVAAAQEGILMDPKRNFVVVWRSEYAMEEGLRLIDTGQPEAVAKRAVCIVDNNTKAVKIGDNWKSFRILVIEGKNKGCEGTVEQFYSRR